MEITTMQMYWLVKLDDLRCFIEGLVCLPIVLVICGLIGAIIFTVMYFFGDNEDYKLLHRNTHKEFKNIRATLWKLGKICIKTGIVSITIAIVLGAISDLIPSTKQMAAIIIVPKIVNSEKVQTVGNKVYDLSVEWLKELKPNKKESEVK